MILYRKQNKQKSIGRKLLLLSFLALQSDNVYSKVSSYLHWSLKIKKPTIKSFGKVITLSKNTEFKFYSALLAS